ncbi:hypothetical protein [Pedobacter sp. SYP-B3415]|uniref:hypothetical protein n=1 Tax=Pedobacter sp. SYP-B3415 TaxID=2496641 RepID=UPI00101DA201|nr:hypothetical protein [Pedobacter sp. SYP-B3415]
MMRNYARICLVGMVVAALTACSSEQKDNANDTVTKSSGYSDSSTIDTTKPVDTTNAPPIDTVTMNP